MSRLKETYHLINSMSSGEKRFFNIFSNRYKTINAVNKLFDVLENLEVWDKQKFQKAIEKQKISTSISATNTKLLNEITTALRLHNETNIIDLEINKYIEEIRLLSKKNIFELGNAKLNKAEKLASDAEKHERLLEIFLLKRILSVRKLSNEEAHKLSTKLSLERLDLLKIIENKEQYSLLSQEIFYLYRKYGNPKNENEKNKFEEIINNKLLKDISLARSSSAINSYYFVYTVYYIIFQKLEEALLTIEKQITALESKEGYLKSNLDQYISVLNNAIYVNSELRNNENFLFYINKLRSLPETYNFKNRYFKKRIFETSHSLELDYYLQTSQYDKLNESSIFLEKKLDNLSKKGLSKDKFLSFSYSISLNFYYQENFNKARDVLYNLMLEDDKTSNLQWFYQAKILDLIVHFELKNYKFLMNRIKSVKRFLKINNLLSEIDIEFLKLLKNAPTSYNNIDDFEKFLLFINKREESETKKFYSDYIKVELWCTSKINNTSFKENLSS